MNRQASAWHRVHFGASAAVTLVATVHVGLTPLLYRHWTPDAVWFVGAGLGLMVVGVVNLALLHAGPAWDHTARVVRWTNVGFALFAAFAVLAIPNVEAIALLGGLVAEAVASHWTLPGPA